MAITSKDIDNQSFSVDRKGYSIEEVDIFLERVSSGIKELNEKVSVLENKVEEEKAAAVSGDKVKELNDIIVKQNGEIERLKNEVNAKADDGRAISEALIVAQRSAEKIVQEANDKAAKIIKDANEKADYIEKDADSQKKKVLVEIEKLEKTEKETRKQYQVMLRDIINSMEKHLNDSEGLHNVFVSGTAKIGVVEEVKENVPVVEEKHEETPDANPAPVNPEPQKDFSGFGDADFGEDKID